MFAIKINVFVIVLKIFLNIFYQRRLLESQDQEKQKKFVLKVYSDGKMNVCVRCI